MQTLPGAGAMLPSNPCRQMNPAPPRSQRQLLRPRSHQKPTRRTRATLGSADPLPPPGLRVLCHPWVCRSSPLHSHAAERLRWEIAATCPHPQQPQGRQSQGGDPVPSQCSQHGRCCQRWLYVGTVLENQTLPVLLH